MHELHKITTLLCIPIHTTVKNLYSICKLLLFRYLLYSHCCVFHKCFQYNISLFRKFSPTFLHTAVLKIFAFIVVNLELLTLIKILGFHITLKKHYIHFLPQNFVSSTLLWSSGFPFATANPLFHLSLLWYTLNSYINERTHKKIRR